MRWLAGSGAKNRPTSRAAAVTARFGTPGSTTAIRATRSIEMMRRSRAVETTIASAHAIVPPERPVPAPRGTMLAPSACAARTTSATSSVVPGRTTADGGRRSNPASYSQTRRSSARQKTFSSPQISTRRRTSALGEARSTFGFCHAWVRVRMRGGLGLLPLATMRFGFANGIGASPRCARRAPRLCAR